MKKFLLYSLCAVACSSLHAASPDIVFYSGVPCGIAASITAAREGAKGLLIEPTKHVGGLARVGSTPPKASTC